ncbi:4'-phosphopantetheinyl transferase superfamily protein [Tersicoccus sp. Bi-70]|uniref:4'-phosphopantetheinyl transferase family protein n=1 Tax=Tersicoccus sp. Bi-70 TaxID=1897634 RepID=UPI00097862F7|nr:4'-phosphopantetheinyl transferase superfamily protein [Tersicoccus sp. Bi-70]OMH34998.1 hypothetical protein BGP79_01230 [Tersicoccus sp. Bi-70]
MSAVDLVIQPVLTPASPGWSAAVEALGDADRAQLELTAGPAVRTRFVTGRSELRRLAAARLGIPAADVRIQAWCPDCRGPHGAPEVSAPDGRRLGATISHASDRVLVAVADSPVLGADLVEVSAAEFPGFDRAVLARRELVATAPSLRDRQPWRARVWAAKEAVLKATGRGLRLSPTTVELAAPGAETAGAAVLTGSAGRTPFTVTPVAAPAGLVAAVACPD